MDLVGDDQLAMPPRPVPPRVAVSQADRARLVDNVATKLADAVRNGLSTGDACRVPIDLAAVLGPLAELVCPARDVVEAVAVSIGPLDPGIIEHLEVEPDVRVPGVTGPWEPVHLSVEGHAIDDAGEPLRLLDVG